MKQKLQESKNRTQNVLNPSRVNKLKSKLLIMSLSIFCLSINDNGFFQDLNANITDVLDNKNKELYKKVLVVVQQKVCQNIKLKAEDCGLGNEYWAKKAIDDENDRFYNSIKNLEVLIAMSYVVDKGQYDKIVAEFKKAVAKSVEKFGELVLNNTSELDVKTTTYQELENQVLVTWNQNLERAKDSVLGLINAWMVFETLVQHWGTQTKDRYFIWDEERDRAYKKFVDIWSVELLESDDRWKRHNCKSLRNELFELLNSINNEKLTCGKNLFGIISEQQKKKLDDVCSNDWACWLEQFWLINRGNLGSGSSVSSVLRKSINGLQSKNIIGSDNTTGTFVLPKEEVVNFGYEEEEDGVGKTKMVLQGTSMRNDQTDGENLETEALLNRSNEGQFGMVYQNYLGDGNNSLNSDGNDMQSNGRANPPQEDSSINPFSLLTSGVESEPINQVENDQINIDLTNNRSNGNSNIKSRMDANDFRNKFLVNPQNNFNNLNSNIDKIQNYQNSQNLDNMNTNPNAVNVSNNVTIRAQIIPNQNKNTQLKLDLNNIGWKVGTNGLDNIGATCFMNSTLQCLLHTRSLTNWLLNNRSRIIDQLKKNRYLTTSKGEVDDDGYYVQEGFDKNDSNGPKQSLLPYYMDLIDNTITPYIGTNGNGQSGRYAAHGLRRQVEAMNPLFVQGQAGDAKDYIIFLLEEMHKELKQPVPGLKELDTPLNQYDKKDALGHFFNEFQKETSVLSDYFFGLNETTNVCLDCKQRYGQTGREYPICYNYGIFNVLIFPLEEVRKQSVANGWGYPMDNAVSLAECFEYNQKTDLFTGDNRNYCNVCNKLYDSEYTSRIFAPPRVLILIMNRGKGNIYNIKLNFGESLTLMPDGVRINPYSRGWPWRGNVINTNPDNNGPGKDGCWHYDLVGVITHIGQSGPYAHFVASCRNSPNHQWIRYNDGLVNPIDNFQKEVHDFANPYILFYQLRE